MADNNPPFLKRLVLPSTIDLSKGSASFEALIEALDEVSGSGVDYVSIMFDRNLMVDGRSSRILQLNAYSADNFSDATPAVAKSQFTLEKDNAAGVYNIDSVWIRDRAGNNAIYWTSQLEAMGIQTILNVTGSAGDTEAPTLKGLTLPDVVDVSSGSAAMLVTVEAVDNQGGAGVDYVSLEFNRPLAQDSMTGSVFLAGMGRTDTFKDTTPTTASDVHTLSNMSTPGTYALYALTLYDQAGNQRRYTAEQLKAMGIDTTMEVVGGINDTVGPKLIDLWLPQHIALDAEPRQVAAAVAQDAPGGTGVNYVSVIFDRPLGLKEFPSHVLSIGAAGSMDNFKDATKVFATGGFTLADTAAPGTYHVTGVIVRDIAGNTTQYFSDELKQLGINTMMTIVEGKPTATVEASAAGRQVELAFTSRDWASEGPDAVSLKLRYDPTQGKFAGVDLVGAAMSPLSAKVSENGNVGTVTITGAVALHPEARIYVSMDMQGSSGAFGYTVDSFTVNGKTQLFAQERSGNVLLGTAGADHIGTAGMGSYIDGGASVDLAVFSGARDDYRISKTAAGFVVDNFIDAPVTLVNVERLEFLDKSYALDIGGSAGQVYRLYQAAFDRQPDEYGIGYWMGVMDGGASLAQVAGEFLHSYEFETLYGYEPSDEAFITALYDNVLHRAPDQAGFDYWVNTVKTTGDRIGALVQFSESAENVAQVVGTIGDGFAYYA